MRGLEMMVSCFSFDDSGEPGQFGYDALTNLADELKQFVECVAEKERLDSDGQNYLLLMARRMNMAGNVAFELGRKRSRVPYTNGDPFIALLRANGESSVAAALEAKRMEPGASTLTDEQWWVEVERYRRLSNEKQASE